MARLLLTVSGPNAARSVITHAGTVMMSPAIAPAMVWRSCPATPLSPQSVTARVAALAGEGAGRARLKSRTTATATVRAGVFIGPNLWTTRRGAPWLAGLARRSVRRPFAGPTQAHRAVHDARGLALIPKDPAEHLPVPVLAFPCPLWACRQSRSEAVPSRHRDSS